MAHFTAARQEPATSAAPMLPPASQFWAKYDRATGEWHSLMAHCADVAAVMAELLTPTSVGLSALASRLAAAAGIPELHAGHRAALVYLTALHDLGKTSHGFQAKIRREARRQFSDRGHVGVLLRSLRLPVLQPVIDAALAPLPLEPDAALTLFCTVVCHHGRPGTVPTCKDDPSLVGLWQHPQIRERDPIAAMRALAESALRWSGLAEHADVPPLMLTPQFSHLVAGAVTLADWIGSTEDAFRLRGEMSHSELDPYWIEARRRAADVCRSIGVTPKRGCIEYAEPSTFLRALFPNPAEPVPNRFLTGKEAAVW